MKFFLTGFMGSGKSHLGALLATKLDFSFLDMDAVLEEKEQTTIADLIKKEGMETFRLKEHNCLLSLLNKRENLVIATGGGTPCFYKNMDWINQNGLSIYLDAPTKLIAKRLEKETEKRPLVQGLKGNALEEKINKLLQERLVFYRQAHFQLEQYPGQAEKEAIKKILEFLQPYLK